MVVAQHLRAAAALRPMRIVLHVFRSSNKVVVTRDYYAAVVLGGVTKEFDTLYRGEDGETWQDLKAGVYTLRVRAGDAIDWDPHEALAPLDGRGRVVTRSDDLLAQMLDAVRPGDHVVFMSNGGFDSAPMRFSEAVQKHEHR